MYPQIVHSQLVHSYPVLADILIAGAACIHIFQQTLQYNPESLLKCPAFVVDQTRCQPSTAADVTPSPSHQVFILRRAMSISYV